MDPGLPGRACDGGREQEEFQADGHGHQERYYAKYRGKGGLEEGEVPQGTSGSEEAGPSSAPAPGPWEPSALWAVPT